MRVKVNDFTTNIKLQLYLNFKVGCMKKNHFSFLLYCPFPPYIHTLKKEFEKLEFTLGFIVLQQYIGTSFEIIYTSLSTDHRMSNIRI